MATVTTNQGNIAEILRRVMKLYRYVLEMGLEEKERLILRKISEASKNIESFWDIHDACQSVLIEYPTGLPHENTLIEEASKRMTIPSREIMPNHPFDKDMLVYKWMDTTIERLFSKIDRTYMDRVDQNIIEKLQRIVHNTLVDNPNFKGAIPYYKKNYSEYDRAKKLWLELLDNEFEGFIRYFEDEE
ncbi:hypothetical protein SMD22_00785 (plasmid) [Brevibacillus halotolerans]|nr:hypothetical protein SMD22_00785 [Brevibacillus halotolerans]